jgi:hypothetical protein
MVFVAVPHVWLQQHVLLWREGAVCPHFPLSSADSITQQQDEEVLPSAELMTAAAQPTPARTLIAPTGQFLLHAPHSMHASRFWISTFPFCLARTSCGHTWRQVPQPVQTVRSSFKVVTSFK